MLEKQRDLTKRTEALDKSRGPDLTRKQRIDCARDHKGEGELRDETDQAIDLTPRRARRRSSRPCWESCARTSRGSPSSSTSATQASSSSPSSATVERTLEELIEVIKKEIEERRSGGKLRVGPFESSSRRAAEVDPWSSSSRAHMLARII